MLTSKILIKLNLALIEKKAFETPKHTRIFVKSVH